MDQSVAETSYPKIMQASFKVGDPALEQLFQLITHMAEEGISDVQIHPDKPARWLRNGKYELLPEEHPLRSFTEREVLIWLSWSTGDDPDPLGDRGHASVAVEGPDARLRGTFRRSMQGFTATFRLVPGEVPNPDVIGVPKVIQELTKRKSGLVLVEGPTGSGKTTLIASLLSKVNHESDRHIYTVEHPIEFVHTEVGNSSIVQREIGLHALDYPTAIEDALRSKPNVILIGEILNPATAKAALHAATTGHLVFSTAHAGSVEEALDGFIGQFTADEQPQVRQRLASSLLAVVVQQLIPTVDGRLAPGREVLMNNRDVAGIIRESKSQMVSQRLASNRGSNMMEDSVAYLVHQGVVEESVGLAHVRDEEKFLRKLGDLRGAAAPAARRGLVSAGRGRAA